MILHLLTLLYNCLLYTSRPSRGQIDDLLYEIQKVNQKGQKTLVTTLTKKMAEDLTKYLQEAGVKVQYLH